MFGQIWKQILESIGLRFGRKSVRDHGSESGARSKPAVPIDYAAVYEKLYQEGYHSDPEFSNANDLVEWVLAKLEFQNVLDIGCAGGWALEKLSQSGKQAQGLDVAETAVKLCRERGLNAVRGSAHALPFQSGHFDLVISTDCLEHLNPEDVPAAVSEIRRVARRWVALKICPNVDVGNWKENVGHDLHLTVEPLQWWKRQLIKEGDRILFEDGVETLIFEKAS